MKDNKNLLNQKFINSNLKNKRTIIISITAIALIILITIGFVLFFLLKKETGKINIEGNNINIEVSSDISGMKNPPILQPIIIKPESSSASQSWQNINLIFENKESSIIIKIKLENLDQFNSVELIYKNNTSTNNLYITNEYFYDENSYIQEINSESIILPANKSVTFISSFNIKNADNSINDVLDIKISCKSQTV